MKPSLDKVRKWTNRKLLDPLKDKRRYLRRLLVNPRLALAYADFQRHVSDRDWHAALELIDPLAEMALAGRDILVLKAMAEGAGRLGKYETAADLGLACARLQGDILSSDWQGESLGDATLVVRFMESEKQGLAIGLNMTGYVQAAQNRAGHCVLIVEKRLVPIFQRTLPGVEVRPYPCQPVAKAGTRLVTANALLLKFFLGCSVDLVQRRFSPLAFDRNLAAAFRNSYRGSSKLPVVGISWWSSHHGKDLPCIQNWVRLMEALPAIYVSMQYDPPTSDLAALRAVGNSKFVEDDSVDQMQDMDRFSAQMGAVDFFISVSNTGAHLAGGLGVRTFVIRDDWFRRGWPVLSDRTPWYPNTQVVGRDGGSWDDVFELIRKAIQVSIFQVQDAPATSSRVD